VIFCEKSPYESVQTNINGVQNIISAALENQVGRVIFTSSDKAVNPTSVMGTSKLMGERLITAANYQSQKNKIIFSSTRFGNVLGSSGSVIPIFMEQIKRGGPVTITDKEMSRFIMSISQAVRLVIESANLAKGGEVFITKMPVIRIADLAQVMIEELAPQHGFAPEDIDVTYIGAKPGEKLYEELMSSEETRRSVELTKYFCVLPAFRDIYKRISYEYDNIVARTVTNPYVSAAEEPFNREQLREFLRQYKLLKESGDTRHLQERYWPGDKARAG
jgi:FlaA1/EpsC-like NDP-sugar epimerase